MIHKHQRTLDQNRLYWRQVQELGLREREEARRGIVYRCVGKTSSRELTEAEMRTVIDYQEYLLHRRSDPPITCVQGATAEQKELLHRLEKGLGWHEDPRRLAGFVRKMTKERTDDVDRLRRQEASLIIEALKSMSTRRRERVIPGPGSREGRSA